MTSSKTAGSGEVVLTIHLGVHEIAEIGEAEQSLDDVGRVADEQRAAELLGLASGMGEDATTDAPSPLLATAETSGAGDLGIAACVAVDRSR